MSLETALHRISANWTLLFEPGARLAYSNTGFALLGAIMARSEGVSWEHLLTELASDLGMGSTDASPPSDLWQMAYAYADGGKQVPLYDFGISNPAGGVYSTAQDMAKLLSFLLRDNVSRGKGQPLDAATVRSWLRTRVWQNPTTVVPRGMWYTGWGVPWQVLTTNLEGMSSMSNFSRFDLISKDGSVPGYHSQLVLQPDLKLGLFTSMTTSSSAGVPSFFSESLLELGLRVVPALLPLFEAAQPSRLPPVPSDYIGHYCSAGTEGDGEGGGSISRIEIGISPKGPFGTSTLTILSNNVGWPPYQPVAWVRDDSFLMIPLPTANCWGTEGGDNWPLRFGRTEGAVTFLTVDGSLIDHPTLYRV